MSSHDEDAKELQPTFAQGYKLGEKKTVDEYAELDKGDESLNRWKASLGIGAEAPEASAKPSGPGVTVTELFLESPTLPPGHSIKFDLNNAGAHKDKVVNIKEDVEYK
ncbi:hypothetical protein FRB90_004069 [Tulasnella sp. 427]|nr:hypothetical protein FRB90_004069 [Tulasnella sp. 427]